MKVLLINGSPRHAGNTFIALSEVAGALEAKGVRTQIVQLGNKPVRGCIACGKCADLGRCVFDDPLYDEVRVAQFGQWIELSGQRRTVARVAPRLEGYIAAHARTKE